MSDEAAGTETTPYINRLMARRRKQLLMLLWNLCPELKFGLSSER